MPAVDDAPESPKPPVTRSLKHGVVYGVVSFASTAVISLVSAVVVARVFGAGLVGGYALAFAPTGLLMVLSSVREQAALVRALSTLQPGDRRATALFLATLGFSTALTLVVSIPVLVVAYFVLRDGLDRPDLFGPAAALVLVNLLMQNVSWNIDSVLSSFRAADHLLRIRLHQALVYPIVAFGASRISLTVWALVAAFALSTATSFLHRVAVLRRYLATTTAKDLKAAVRELPEMVRWGLKLAPGGILDGVGKEAATLVLGYQLPVAAVGAYNRAWLLTSRLFDLNYRVGEMLFPTLVQRRAAGEHAAFRDGLIRAMRLVSVLTLLPAAAAGGASAAVLSVFGPEFEQASTALALMLLVPWFLGVSSVQGNALLAFDRLWTPTLIVCGRFILIVVLLIVCTNAWQLSGVGVALAAAYGAEWWATSVATHRAVRDVRAVRSLGTPKLALAYAASFAASHSVMELVGTDPLGALVSVSAGGLMFVVVLLGTRWAEPAEFDLARGLLARFRPGSAL